MRNILSVLAILLTLSACNGGDATDAGIDADVVAASDAAQDNGPIGPDVAAIDAMDASIDAPDVSAE